MADMTAFITLKLKDQLTQPLNKVKGGLSALSTSQSGLNQSATKATGGMKKLAEAEKRIAEASRQATAAMGEQEQQQNSLSKSMKQFIAGGALTLGANRMKAAISGAVGSVKGEQEALGSLATLGIKNFDLMTKGGREMQQTLGMSADTVIAAVYDVKSGVESLSEEGALAVTKSAAITAKATEASVGQMTELFSMAYNKYKYQFAEMGDAAFADMFASSLSKSVQKFMTNGSKMQAALNAAGTSKFNMHEQLAVLGMLQSAGVQAGESGTALKAFEANVYNAQERLAKKGKKVNFVNPDKTVKSVQEIMAEIERIYNEDGIVDAAEKAELKEAFGTEEAIKLIDNLINKNDELKANTQDLSSADGDHIQMAQAALDANKLSKLNLIGSNMDVLKKTIGDALVPALAAVAPYIIDIIQGLTAFVENNQGLAAIIGGLALGLTGIASVAGPVLMVLPGLSMLAKGLAIARTAMLGFNMALLANPITWIIAGIAALAGSAYLIYKNWDGIKEWMVQFWSNIKQKCATAFTFIKKLFGWHPLGLIINNWGGVTGALANPIEAAKALIDRSMGGIKNLFKKAPSLDEWAAQHNQSKAAIDGHLSQIKALTGARFDALDAIEKMTDAEKEQARQSAESAKLEAALTKGNTQAAIEKQMRNKRNWGEGLNMLKDIENGGSATELQAALQAMSTVSENGQLKLDLKGTGLNQTEYQNLVAQVNELVALEEQAKTAQKAIDRLDGKMDADINPPPPKPKPKGGSEETEAASARPKDLEQQPEPTKQAIDTDEAKKAADGLAQSLEKLKNLKKEAQAAVKDAESFLSKVDWSNHGLRMMQTLAQGIQTGGPIVRTAVQQQLAGLPNGGSNTSNKGLYDGE